MVFFLPGILGLFTITPRDLWIIQNSISTICSWRICFSTSGGGGFAQPLGGFLSTAALFGDSGGALHAPLILFGWQLYQRLHLELLRLRGQWGRRGRGWRRFRFVLGHGTPSVDGSLVCSSAGACASS